MGKSLLDLVRDIHLSDQRIETSRIESYARRASAPEKAISGKGDYIAKSPGSDCCYGADCGDCDCGGYCVD